MLVLLSPAKTLDETSAYAETMSEPRFAAEADALAQAAAKLGPRKLADLMDISDRLASLNAARFRDFDAAVARPAIRSFAGDVYRGFDAASAEPEVIAYAQDHVRILSGLYGVLRPLDAMKPYRLEMGTGWAPGRKRDLYGWWGPRVADALVGELEAMGSRTIVNCASQEYAKVALPHLTGRAEIVSPRFLSDGPTGVRMIAIVAKVARGTMARWICEERPADAAGLDGFDADGWRRAPEHDRAGEPAFVRG